MKTSAVIDHFGSIRQAAEALSLTTQSIYAWGEEVPTSRQAHVELASKGKIKRDKPVYGAK